MKLYPLVRRRPALTRLLVGALLACAGEIPIAANAAEAPLAAVDAVQWPVWVERGGARRPLAAGETVQRQDRLLTGAGGRVLLRMADGSGVKLGENAQLAVNGLGQEKGVLNAALDVARGAFRFTTGLFSAKLNRRNVSVRVSTITAGIRGTDVWGKSDQERDLVCLLEGRISVSHPQLAEAQIMAEAMTFLAADRGQAPAAVVPVDPAQVARWAAETDVETGKGVARAAGKWQVRLATTDSQAAALAVVDAATALGYPARVRPRSDGTHYEVRIRHLASQAEATAIAGRLSAALKLGGVSVTR